MDPSEIIIPINVPVLAKDGTMVPVWWNFFTEISRGLSSVDLATQVTGILAVINGGTSGVLARGSVTTGAIGAGLSAVVTVTWPTAFADATYNATASVLDATAASASLVVVHIETKTAAAITVRVLNNSAGVLTGTVQALGLRN